MGNLRDQLKKAKILSDKDAKRLEHEARIARKSVSRDDAEAAEEQRRSELEALRERQRERDRERQAAIDAERRAHEERAACLEILRREVIEPRRSSGQRWFFQTPDGKLPWLQIEATESNRLVAGQLCIVRRGAGHVHDYCLLPSEHADRIAKALPECVVWRARA